MVCGIGYSRATFHRAARPSRWGERMFGVARHRRRMTTPQILSFLLVGGAITGFTGDVVVIIAGTPLIAFFWPLTRH
jgi:hypothetical protein